MQLTRLFSQLLLFVVSSIAFSQPLSEFESIMDSSLNLAHSSPEKAFEIISTVNSPNLTSTQKAILFTVIGQIHYRAGNSMDSVKENFLSAFDLFSTIREDSLAFESLFELGIKNRRTGLYHEALNYYQLAADFAKQTNQRVLHGDGINAMGVVHFYQGDNLNALKKYLRAMHIYEDAGIPSKIAKSYNNIGIIYKHFNNYELAIEYYERSLEIRKAHNISNRNAPYYNLNELYHFIGDHQKALSYSLEAYQQAIEEKNINWQIDLCISIFKDYKVLNHPDSMLIMANLFKKLETQTPYTSALYDRLLAQYYLKIERPNQALKVLERALPIFQETTDLNNTEWAHLYMADAYAQKRNFQQSISHSKQALGLATQENYSPMISEALERLHGFYKSAGHYQLAYETSEQIRQREDSIYNESKASIIGGMEARMDLAEEENRNKLLEKEASIQKITIKNQRILILSTVAIFMGLLAIGWLAYQQQSIKKRLTESELRATKERQKLLNADLEFKNQELINFATQITHKNEWLEKLRRKLTQLKDLSQHKEYKETLELISKNETISKDREEFDHYVQQVHEGFFSKLGEYHPNLSITEKRLAALLRLELSSKQIATILNIAPKSVDMNRYRLRKKMNLDAKANLTQTLQSL